MNGGATRWVLLCFVLAGCGHTERGFGVADESSAGHGGAGVSAGGAGEAGIENTGAGNTGEGGNTSGRGGEGAQDGGSPGDAGSAGAESDLCAGVSCTSGPPGSCESATQFKSYDKIGSCEAGVCKYAEHLIACTCTAGACTTDPCVGIQCMAPPAPQCRDTNTLTTYSSPGTCDTGSCNYVAVDKTCAYGCSAGACLLNPCNSVSCNEPDQCHSGPGTCAPATGKCSYPEKADNSPCSNVDNNACTADVCKSGVCTSGAVKTCPAPALCKTQGACSASTGTCSTPAAADHTSCGTNLECIGGNCSCTRTSCPNGCCNAAGACGSCAPSNVLTRSNPVQDLSLASSLLYFLESSSLVYSVSTAGGTPTFLSYPPPAETLTAIVADGSYVYAAKFGNTTPAVLGRMPAIGGPFTSLAGSATYEGTRLQANSTSVFAGSTLSSNYITVSPKTGGPPNAIFLVSSVAVDQQHFAVNDAYLYFISSNSSAISRIPVTGGAATAVATASPGETIADLALAGTQLIVATSTRVAKVATTGGTLATLVTGAAYLVRTDASNAYYFSSKGANCASGTDIFSMPIAGGNLRRLATEPTPGCLFTLAQDASALYWPAGNLINKVAK